MPSTIPYNCQPSKLKVGRTPSSARDPLVALLALNPIPNQDDTPWT